METSVTRVFLLFCALVCALGAALIAPAPASAQKWPERTITLVVPFAAGSATDVLGRVVAAGLGEALSATVIVENVSGAGGMTGSARVARAEPDGYQVVLGNVATHAQNQSLYRSPAYNPETDFEPVALVADLPAILIGRTDIPATSLKEFVAYLKQNQSKLQFGSAGTGSASHLGCALLHATAGVDVTHVPYRSAPLAMQDLVAGRIDYQCGLLPSPIGQIREGQVKAFALLANARSAALPDLPTAEEQGMAGVEASAWHGLFLPKGTPADIVQKLNAAMSATLDNPKVRSQLATQGALIPAADRRSPEQLRAFVKSEIERWGRTIRSMKIELN
jgi:tripartite-type tricarboxylate transporter receptor subunit TctC